MSDDQGWTTVRAKPRKPKPPPVRVARRHRYHSNATAINRAKPNTNKPPITVGRTPVVGCGWREGASPDEKIPALALGSVWAARLTAPLGADGAALTIPRHWSLHQRLMAILWRIPRELVNLITEYCGTLFGDLCGLQDMYNECNERFTADQHAIFKAHRPVGYKFNPISVWKESCDSLYEDESTTAHLQVKVVPFARPKPPSQHHHLHQSPTISTATTLRVGNGSGGTAETVADLGALNSIDALIWPGAVVSIFPEMPTNGDDDHPGRILSNPYASLAGANCYTARSCVRFLVQFAERFRLIDSATAKSAHRFAPSLYLSKIPSPHAFQIMPPFM